VGHPHLAVHVQAAPVERAVAEAPAELARRQHGTPGGAASASHASSALRSIVEAVRKPLTFSRATS
jgi:hypothetical protein